MKHEDSFRALVSLEDNNGLLDFFYFFTSGFGTNSLIEAGIL